MNKQNKRQKTIRRALVRIQRKEKRLGRAAQNRQPAPWKMALEEKIPPKVYAGLESAFYKGFTLVFCQGRSLIEKSCHVEKRRAEFYCCADALEKGDAKVWKHLCKTGSKAEFANLAATTLEGIGLGALGIGLPDIVLFLGNLMKGIYEVALSYGFGFETHGEQFLILKMMETALCRGSEFLDKNEEVDRLLGRNVIDVTEKVLEEQMQRTSAAFAMDMLLLKFLQGIPVAGIIGGAANPVYYRRVMNYITCKYRKGCLQKADR